ncbi:MAG: heavy metal translocating P-type ATPase [Oscillospiraceae bacterium]|nr:heavy metal translocating P-type ATPase [Oscillospiraceae bacterium]
MKYKIIYDEPGRLRVRMGKYAFTNEQGYGIEAHITAHEASLQVEATAVNGGLLVNYKPGHREDIIALIEGLSRDNLPVSKAQSVNYKRELDDSFARALAYRVCRHYLKKLLPMPVRIFLTLLDATRFWKQGIVALTERKLNVDVLDASAILVTIAQGHYAAASSIMTLLRISELLEDYTKKKARQTLTQSLALNIDCVWVVQDGTSVYVPVSQVKVGDTAVVYSGTIIPLDGEVLSGEALVNESSMTGEPHGVRRGAGDSVFAGTVVEEGNIEFRVRTLAENSRISNIVSLIDNSENLKASIQGKAENLADKIVPFSFIASAITLLLTRSITRATTVLTVDYSCAIKLTTPISIISAMQTAANQHILIKGGKFLEAFANADTIVFDKTGTLTNACPNVAKVIPFGRRKRETVLKMAACLEEHFPHSVAKAVVRQAEIEKLGHREEHAEPEYIVAHGISSKVKDKRVLIGSWHFITEDEGVTVTDEQMAVIKSEGEGYSSIYLAVDGKLAGMLCIDDPVRSEAREVLDKLRSSGIEHIIMLTGDSAPAAKIACAKLGITEYYAGVLPEGKADIIRALKDEGRTVIMVGDGINDSPALAQADVSVAMMDGSDIAKEVADISLMAENLDGLVTLRNLSQNVFAQINSNFSAIVAFNTALLLLGAGGLIQPTTSAALHNTSTMLLCGLSMRNKM